MEAPAPSPPPRTAAGPFALLVLVGVTLAALAVPAHSAGHVRAQSCPPYCETPVITPAWHLHMCDETYEDQLDDGHCMSGPGVTEFPSGTDRVFIIYCHRSDDTVRIVVKDSGGGEQFVNHPDGITYRGNRCESIEYRERTGIPPGGSPYFTSASWPEGPFSGIGAGVEWFVGLYVLFDADVYYGLGAEAAITARDPASNLDPFLKERITVQVTSDLDPVGIPVVLEEQNSGLPVFRSLRGVRFSTEASNAAAGVIKVADRSTLTVRYCPRACQTPYVDDALWLAGDATVTPTPLPTYAGPRPTVTPTPPPELRLETVTLRPEAADVGYGPQISNNKSRVNHLGYPTIYAGMWTKGDNVHYGMIQFDLSSLPPGAPLVSARLELVGKTRQFYSGGVARVELLDGAIDALWRDATWRDVDGAPFLAQIGSELTSSDLAEGRVNAFGFSAEQLALVAERARTTRRLSLRIAGPRGTENSLFAWHSGVDVYGREQPPPDPALRPALVLSYGTGPTATPGGSTATPSPPFGTPPPTAGPTASIAPTGGAPTTTPPSSPARTATPSVTLPAPPGTTTAAPSPTGAPSAEPSATPAAPASATPEDPPATPAGPPTGRQVCVLAFDDRDGDGLRDPNERFLAGVTLRLVHEPSSAFVTWTTDGANDPDYCWNGLSDGRYVLRIDDLPAGLVASGPASVAFDVPLASTSVTFAFGARDTAAPTASPAPTTFTPPAPHTPTGQATHTSTPRPTASPTPTPTASPTVLGPAGVVCVAVFEDRDGNGFRDAGEPNLEGAEILVETEARAPARRLVSRADAEVCARVAAGVYFVVVRPAPGAAATTATEQAVLVTAGSQQALVFGQRVAARRPEPVFLPIGLRPRHPNR